MLLAASASLEWARLYRLEPLLPGHSGGVLGFWVGSAGERWFGFTGAAVLGLSLVVLGLSWVFRFSWGELAESLGSRIDGLIQSRHVKREIQEDMALGQRALRERGDQESREGQRPAADAADTAAAIRAAKEQGRRVIAVGTTSARLLESAWTPDGIQPFSADTRIFITPGFRFAVVDGLLTNFHLPKSTLFMLVSALMGRERMQEAYAHAIAEGYRFYSYGDSSLLLPVE